MLEKYESLCEQRQARIISRDLGNRREHRAENREGCVVRQYRIDGTIIKGTDTKKCDYLLFNEDKHTAYLIELKGKHIHDAIKQLEETEEQLQEDLKGYQKLFRIVYRSNTHAIRSKEYTEFCKRKKGRVKAKTDILEEVI